MRWDRVHLGNVRQGPMSEEEIEAAEEQGITPGINPDLRAPVISPPGDEPEVNLHGDIEGSPYSSNPGEISMEEARKQAEAAPSAAADDAETREREIESRKTGRSQASLAAEADAEEPAPSPKRARSK